MNSTIIKSTCGKLAAIAAICVASPLSSWAADRTISADYTLSADETVDGTLTVESGVTVDLAGHTLTVNGLAGSGTITTPYKRIGDNDEYYELEYIEATGAQYFDSGVYPCTHNDNGSGNVIGARVKTRVAVTSTDQYHSIIGNAYGYKRENNSTTHVFVGMYMDGKNKRFALAYKTTGFDYTANNTLSLNTPYDVEVSWYSNGSAGSQYLNVDGVRQKTLSSKTSWGINSTMYVFARHVQVDVSGYEANTVDTYSKAKMYSMKIYRPYNATTPVRDYVPAMRVSDGAVGMYDTVNKTFSPSATSTAFVAGPKRYAENGGELHLVVASGQQTNSTLAIAGSLKFVKEGEGTFVADKSGQTYSGGTVVDAGTLKPTLAGSTGRPLGDPAGSVEVKADALLDLNGMSGFHEYSFVLDGGEMKSSVSDIGDGYAMLNKMTLTANSVFTADNSYGFIGGGYALSTLDLGGNTLRIDLASDKNFYLINTAVKNGTVDITSGGCLQTGNNQTGANVKKEIVATNADFKVNCSLNLCAPLSVRDYKAIYDGANNAGTAALKVYGTFTPVATNRFYGCTMQNDSTIDLSGISDTWSTTSSFTTGSRVVTFADGARVYVKLGERSVTSGTKVVGWESEPANMGTLVFICADADFAISKQNDGLYLCDPVYDINDAKFATFEDALASRLATADHPLRLPADEDARALGTLTIPAGSVIDLNGYNLTVSGLAGSGTITAPPLYADENKEYAVLEYIQATGAQYFDTGVYPCSHNDNGSGNVFGARVKTRVAITSTDQYHSIIGNAYGYKRVNNSTTHIFVGMYMDGKNKRFALAYKTTGFDYTANNSLTLNTPYDVEVSWYSNGSAGSQYLNVDGVRQKTLSDKTSWGINSTMYVFARHVQVVVSGYEANTVDAYSKAKMYSMQIYRPYNAATPVRDYVPAKRVSDGAVGMYDTVNKTFSPSATATPFVAGPVVYASAPCGELHIDVAEGVSLTNSTVTLAHALRLVKEGEGTFVANKAGQTYSGGTELRAGTIDSGSPSLSSPFGSVAAVEVYANLDVSTLNYSTFKMMDGSTLDLSGCAEAYDASGFTFADNATVNVKLGTRRVGSNTKIVDWTGNTPSNLDMLTFKSADGETFSVKKRGDGLYVGKGFVIIVK